MAMSVMGTASMLRARRRDVNVKPNRRLDRKSSRGMLYENEELRLRTININAEVERGQNDIKKLRRENELLRREIWGLREEYDRLESLLGILHNTANSSDSYSDLFKKQNYDEEGLENRAKSIENENSEQNVTHVEVQSCGSCSRIEFKNSSSVDAYSNHNRSAPQEDNYKAHHITRLKNNLESIFPVEDRDFPVNEISESHIRINSDMCGNQYASSYEIPSMLELPQNRIWNQPLFSIDESNVYCATNTEVSNILSNNVFPKTRRDILKKSQSEFSLQIAQDQHMHEALPLQKNHCKYVNQALPSTCRNRKETTKMRTNCEVFPFTLSQNNLSEGENCNFFAKKSLFPEGGNLEDLLSDMHKKSDQLINPDSSGQRFQNSEFGFWYTRPNEVSDYRDQNNEQSIVQRTEDKNISADDKKQETKDDESEVMHLQYDGMATTYLDNQAYTSPIEENASGHGSNTSPYESKGNSLKDNFTNTKNLSCLRNKKWLSQSEQILNIDEKSNLEFKSASFSSFGQIKMKYNLSCGNVPRYTEINVINKNNGSSEDKGTNFSWDCHRRRSMPIMNDGRSSSTVSKNKLEVLGHSSFFSVQHHSMNEENILKQEIANEPTDNMLLQSSLLANTNEISDSEFNTNPTFQKGSERKPLVSCPDKFNKYKAKNKNGKYVPTDGMFHCIQSYTRTNHNSSGFGSHFKSLHKMSVIVGDTERGRAVFLDQSLSSCWKDPHINGHFIKQMTVCSNNQRKIGICAREDTHLRNNDNSDHISENKDSCCPKITSTFPLSRDVSFKGVASGRSISWERTNSIDSSSSSLDAHVNTNRTKCVRRTNSVEEKAKEPVPWCGCWGNGCI